MTAAAMGLCDSGAASHLCGKIAFLGCPAEESIELNYRRELIASGKIPLGGTAMFALLAMAGDLGGSIGPGVVGLVTQSANDNLRAGMLAGSFFPAILILSVFLLRRKRAAAEQPTEGSLLPPRSDSLQ